MNANSYFLSPNNYHHALLYIIYTHCSRNVNRIQRYNRFANLNDGEVEKNVPHLVWNFPVRVPNTRTLVHAKRRDRAINSAFGSLYRGADACRPSQRLQHTAGKRHGNQSTCHRHFVIFHGWGLHSIPPANEDKHDDGVHLCSTNPFWDRNEHARMQVLHHVNTSYCAV